MFTSSVSDDTSIKSPFTRCGNGCGNGAAINWIPLYQMDLFTLVRLWQRCHKVPQVNGFQSYSMRQQLRQKPLRHRCRTVWTSLNAWELVWDRFHILILASPLVSILTLTLGVNWTGQIHVTLTSVIANTDADFGARCGWALGIKFLPPLDNLMF